FIAFIQLLPFVKNRGFGGFCGFFLGWQNVLATERSFWRSRPGGADGQTINPRTAGSGRGTVAGADGVPGLRPPDALALR
ncbi:MAG TPA: hypothetical protein VEQ17_08010, partial [Steroidobacteraceae bacterium]|nr:hypothetical protein [Steroidobacteraceae bacterium]